LWHRRSFERVAGRKTDSGLASTGHTVQNQKAFSAVMMLLAVCEQTIEVLETVHPRPSRLLESLTKTQAEAVEVARQLAPVADP